MMSSNFCISGMAATCSPSGKRLSRAKGPLRSSWAAAWSSISTAALAVAFSAFVRSATCASRDRLSRPTATTALRSTWLGPQSSRTPHINRFHSSFCSSKLPEASAAATGMCRRAGPAPKRPADNSTPVSRSRRAGVPQPGAAERSAAWLPPAKI
eukprot:Skav209341  [mRNA]  locus=scaffold241:388423:404486:+ [translate_table: standard]